jgi:flagella basal body P-ring formation protein FlgA
MRPATPGAWTIAGLWVAALWASPAGATETWESPERIEARVRAHVEQHSGSHGAPATVTVSTIDPRLRLSRCAQPLETFLPPGGRETGHTTVGVRCRDPKAWTIYVPAQVHVVGEVVVAQRGIARGATLTRADLALRSVDLAALPPGAVTDLRSAEGQLLKRPVAPGTLLTASMMEAVPVIKRGQSVTLLARTGTLEVRVAAEALGNGAAGQRIKVRNLSSRQVVEATVVSEGLVQVSL